MEEVRSPQPAEAAAPPIRDTKFCSECGAQINSKAEICPKCGVRVAPNPSQNLDKNKTVAGLLALFFGTLGIHKFYLGNKKMGVIYLIISITIVGLILTALFSIYDAVVLFTMSESEFAAKFGAK